MTVDEAIALVSETIRNKKCECIDCQAAKVLLNEIYGLYEKVRIAESVRDDARSSSQRYLDEKRAMAAELNELRNKSSH